MERKEKHAFTKAVFLILSFLIGIVLVFTLVRNLFFIENTYREAINNAKACSNYYSTLSLSLALDYIHIKILILFISFILLIAGINYLYSFYNADKLVSKEEPSEIFPSASPGIIMVITSAVIMIVLLFHSPKIEFVYHNDEKGISSSNKELGTDKPIDSFSTNRKSVDTSEHRLK